MQNSPNDTIYQMAYRLVDTYFNDEDVDDNVAEVVQQKEENGEFKFDNKDDDNQQGGGDNQFAF